MSKREKTIAWLVGLVVGGAVMERVVEGMLTTRAELIEKKTLTEKSLFDDQLAMRNREPNQKWLDSMKATSLQRNASDSEDQMGFRLVDCLLQAGINTGSVQYRPPNSSPVKVGTKPNSKEQFMRQVAHMTVPGTMEQVARFAYYVNNSEIPMRITEIQMSPTKENEDNFKVEFGISTVYLTQQQTQQEPARPPQVGTTSKPSAASNASQPGRGAPQSQQNVNARSGQVSGPNTRPAATQQNAARGTGGTPTTRTESVQ